MSHKTPTQSKEVGARIRTAADNAGLSLQELGKRIGVSRPTIYAYAAGTLNVSSERLGQIAAATNQSETFFAPPVSAPSTSRPLEELVDALLGHADLNRAQEVVSESLAHAERVGRQADLASVQFKLGNALLFDGNYLEAVAHLQAARTGFIQRGLTQEAARCSQSLGYAFINTGRIDRAKTCFEEASTNLPVSRRWMGEVSLAGLAERTGDIEEARRLLCDLESRHDLPPNARAYVLSNQASLAATCGLWSESLRLNRMALQTAATSTDQTIERYLQIGRAMVRQGQLDEGSLWLMRACDAASLVADHARRSYAQLMTARLLLAAGCLAEARAMTIEAQSEAIRREHRRSESYALLLLAEIAFGRGDLEAAVDLGLQAAVFCDTQRYPTIAIYARAVVSASHARLGQVSRGQAVLRDATQTSGFNSLGSQRALCWGVEAMLYGAEGEREAAAARSRQAIELASASGDQLLAMAEMYRLREYDAGADAPDLGSWVSQHVHWTQGLTLSTLKLTPPNWTALANP
ncbi:MAG: helix-turn-helix domain-containing protein [Fimbriimonadaceae bacterium]|nr:helix-turn-helix domain-containing protein [Fimbriimonadaceae bacterium]